MQLSLELLRAISPAEYEELRVAVLELRRAESTPAGPALPREGLYERMAGS
jgi:hypothetical protein